MQCSLFPPVFALDGIVKSTFLEEKIWNYKITGESFVKATWSAGNESVILRGRGRSEFDYTIQFKKKGV
jgi:hypothetical protein